MIRKIAAPFITLIITVLAMASAQTPDNSDHPPLVSFEAPEELQAWRTVNDTVMGGRSSGGAGLTDTQLVFSGVLNTRGGGFSSVRRTMEEGALKGSEGLVLSIRSDGRAYRVIARTDARFLGRAVSYQAEIPPSPAGEWSQVDVPFDAFVPSVFGRRVPADPFDPARVNELGFIIADAVDGPFSMQVRAIGLKP